MLLGRNKPILWALGASAALHAAGAAAALFWPWPLPRGRQDRMEITWLAGPSDEQKGEGKSTIGRPLPEEKSGAAGKRVVSRPVTLKASRMRMKGQNALAQAKTSFTSVPERKEKRASRTMSADAGREHEAAGRTALAQAAAVEAHRTAAVEDGYVGAKAHERFSSTSLGDLRPLCLSCPVPRYPLRARREGWQGEVDVGVEIEVDGRVAQATVMRSCGYAALDRTALEVARRSRFSAPSGGRIYRGHIKYRFVLGDP